MREAEAGEARLHGLLESALDGVTVLDRDGRIVQANAEAARIFGYDHGDILGRPVDSLLTAPLPAPGGPAAADGHRGAARMVVAGRHRDGTSVPLEVSLSPQRGPHGPLVAGAIRDLTERHRAQEALRLRDRALEAVGQGLFITDASQPAGPLVYVNPAFERLTGYPRPEALGRPWTFLHRAADDSDALGEAGAAMAEGRSCLVEFRAARKDGVAFWATLSLAPVRDAGGRVAHFVGVLTDVSDQRRLEEQLRQAQKMEAVGRLAGGIAHDFNNLLTVINGFSSLLLQDLGPQDLRRGALEGIGKAGERAAELTRQLLAFSRKQVLAPQVINLNTLVADMEQLLRRALDEGVALVTDFAADLWPVKVDRGQMGQVLLNLVVNARDAMPDGGTLTVRTANAEVDADQARTLPGLQPGPYATLAIRDTGAGMTEEVLAHLFEPFFTTKEQGKGTGLGLATAYGIVKQSGGAIYAQSEPGRGACFTIYLPQAKESLSVVLRRAAAPAAPAGGETVLLVEDEEDVRALAGEVLRRAGYHVLTARDGEEALRAAAAHPGPIHLLLTDVVLPGLGGGELARRLAEARPATAVLFMSGYADDLVVRQGVLRAEEAFLPKPFTADELLEKVRAALRPPERGSKPPAAPQPVGAE
jgi:PAS domain S-box-containing protein